MTRERELVLNAVFCDTNLYLDGPKTVAEAKAQGRSLCPHYEECNESGGFLHPETGHQCAMNMGLQVAQFSIKEGHSIVREMNDFEKENICPKRGWVFSSDRKHFEIAPPFSRAHLGLIEKFAYIALGLEPPEKLSTMVGPNFRDVVRYAATPEGAIDLAKMQELEGRFGSNGGHGCDVRKGPCSCGAWH